MSLVPSLRKFMREQTTLEAMTAIDPALRITSVTLAVSDLDRSIDFYSGTLGLPLVARENGSARLGPDAASPALLLEQLPSPTPLPVCAAGLFHVAWLHPTRAALAETVKRVLAAEWQLEGAADHGVSEALYLSDPDGLGIEIYADRPRETWHRPSDGHGVEIVTLPLDVEDLLAQSGPEPAPQIAAQTIVGHVHMKVADVARAGAFYRDALGFDEEAAIPSAAFLAAGGYHHHVGLNSWQSQSAPRAPESAPGMRLVDFELSDAAAVQTLAQALGERDASPYRDAGGDLLVSDPDGQPLRFHSSSSK
jgi:catechol 2,3-dioxygenase